jgi:HAMP domain-containing protein
MVESPPSPAAGEAQDRPTAARSPRRLTLGTRLTLSVAVSVGLVIGILTLGAMRIAGRALEADLRDTARLTALGVADDIELRPEPITEVSLRPVLEDFINASADLSAISVFTATDGRAVPLISTSPFNVPPLALIEQVISERRSVWNTSIPHLAMVAVPIRHGDDVSGAVAVAVSLSGVERLRRTTGLIAAGGAALALGVLTLLIHLLASRLVLEPLGDIRSVMARARAGDLSARAEVPRDDEMRELADGLNTMLTELEGFQRLLTERVDLATGELRLRNEQLVRSYESVIRLREEAARAQQLAAIGQTVAKRGPSDWNAAQPGLRTRAAVAKRSERPAYSTEASDRRRTGGKGRRIRPHAAGASATTCRTPSCSHGAGPSAPRRADPVAPLVGGCSARRARGR